MKKLIVLPLILILTAGLCFAQDTETQTAGTEPKASEIEKLDLEIYAGFPVHWTNTNHDQDFYWFNPDPIMEDKSVTANTSIGISLTYNFLDFMGANVDFDFFYSTKMAGFSNPSSDYISLFGINMNLGAVFYLYNSNSIRIPLTVGAHFYYYSDDFWMPNLVGQPAGGGTPSPSSGFWINRTDFQLGPVLSLGIQYHFNESIYIFNRTSVSLDLVRIHSVRYIEDDSGTLTDQTRASVEFVSSWSVKPVLGIGIKF